MWIDWDVAAATSVALAVSVVAIGSVRAGWTEARWAQGLRTFNRELSLVLLLYAIWQLAHTWTRTRVTGAVDNALWIIGVQDRLHLPSEATVQGWFLPHPTWVEAMNGYYALVHVPALGIFLIWLFYCHRDRYPLWRNTLAMLTGACLLIQMVPVAPPRMLPGFVDTGLLYEQSVYGRGGSGVANQLAAMPSVHVAWAVLVAVATVQVARSRWRWLVLFHPALTVLAITVTANHWWLDDIVAIALLAAAIGAAQAGARGVAGLSRTGIVARARKLDPSCLPSASPIPLCSPGSATPRSPQTCNDPSPR